MEHFKNIVIETDRLLLIPITMQYAEEIFKEFTQEITMYMTPKPGKDISETKQFIQNSIQTMEA